MKWTEEQQAAIDTRDCNLLVAAGAGSGKTAVLVERIIQKVIKDNIDIDRLLVVTFTNAAASEMRERIAERLYKELEHDISLQKQITLLSKANISTLHAFCLKVIRDNFFLMDLDPNFRIGDQIECELLKIESMEELMEEKYDSDDKEFEELINLYTGNREDTELKDIVLNIHRFIQSTPNPKKWLEEKVGMYDIQNVKDFAVTTWGKLLLNYAKQEVDDEIQALQSLEDYLTDYPKYLSTIQEDIFSLRALREKNATWDDFYNQIQTLEFSNLKPCKEIDEELKEVVKATREKMKKTIKEYLRDNVFVSSSNEILKDMQLLHQNLLAISKFVLEFDQKFTNKKREKNILDFNDIEHIALRILQDNEDVCHMYREKFDEILIDEYQDSNMVQEAIINMISKNRTFMVGDVKQSIYRFRHARPELFLNKYENYSDTSELGKKILLFKNFRSNQNIIEATNYIFKQIMSKELGEIDYSEEEYLQFGATCYSTYGDMPEIHLIETNKDEGNNIEDDIEEKPQLEARVIANRILELVGKTEVYDKKINAMRKADYKDIVILLRATTRYADIFVEELSKKNIPVYSDNQMGYFENTEVQIILSLLKIIDNPMQDIPLIAVMRSQIGNFTIDELTAIRLIDRNCNYYVALQKYMASDASMDESPHLAQKIKQFLDKLNGWREKANYMSLYDLIWHLYNDTGYYYYVSLLPDGMKRQANLTLLLERAKNYEATSYKGVFNFLNYIDHVRDSSGDMESSKLISENENVVRIMSIHKSKGLEFPIVFLSGTSRKFNSRDFQEKIIMHQDLGFGPNIIKYAKRLTYPSIPKLAIIQKAKNEMLSEEMRILYVAMTRAREKLIITAMVNDIDKVFDKYGSEVTHYSVANSNCYFDWIGHCVINHKNEWIIKEWTYEDVLQLSSENDNITSLIHEIDSFMPTEEYRKIDEALSWKYQHAEATTLPTKISISEMKRRELEKEDELKTEITLIEKPSFMEEKVEMKGASYGTKIHYILQHLDYHHPDIESDLIHLDDKTKVMIQKQIAMYSRTNLFERIKKSNKVYRETSFNLNIDANEAYHFEKNIHEEIMLQGIIDLYFVEDSEIVLVDFKSDYVQDEKELIDKYRIQLEYYKKALEEITGMRVKETIIYSLRLGKEITL